MIVINKLTEPGGIRRVEVTPDTIRIHASDGRDMTYRVMPSIMEGSDVCTHAAHGASSPAKS